MCQQKKNLTRRNNLKTLSNGIVGIITMLKKVGQQKTKVYLLSFERAISYVVAASTKARKR
jgi:hypothetical protein